MAIAMAMVMAIMQRPIRASMQGRANVPYTAGVLRTGARKMAHAVVGSLARMQRSATLSVPGDTASHGSLPSQREEAWRTSGR